MNATNISETVLIGETNECKGKLEILNEQDPSKRVLWTMSVKVGGTVESWDEHVENGD